MKNRGLKVHGPHRNYNPYFVDITGSVIAALMLSQALYWSDADNNKHVDEDGWFPMTREGWEREMRITRKEQDTARKALRTTGFWNEQLRGVPPTMHFQIDGNMVTELVNNIQPNLSKRGKSNGIAKKAFNLTDSDHTCGPNGANSPYKKDFNIYIENSDPETQEPDAPKPSNLLPIPPTSKTIARRPKLTRQQVPHRPAPVPGPAAPVGTRLPAGYRPPQATINAVMNECPDFDIEHFILLWRVYRTEDQSLSLDWDTNFVKFVMNWKTNEDLKQKRYEKRANGLNL